MGTGGCGLMKCRAFSTLVADNQYAALGLLLIGILARLRTVLEVLGKELGIEIEIEEIESPALVEEKEVKAPQNDVSDDFGEVVSRTAVTVEEDNVLGEDDQESPVVSKKKDGKKKRKEVEEAQKGKEAMDSTPSKRPKKKRKKGDAFDDLFSGLV
jgi:ribonuclease MRP protein subunit RMP1